MWSENIRFSRYCRAALTDLRRGEPENMALLRTLEVSKPVQFGQEYHDMLTGN